MFLVLKTVLLNDGHHLSFNYYLFEIKNTCRQFSSSALQPWVGLGLLTCRLLALFYSLFRENEMKENVFC